MKVAVIGDPSFGGVQLRGVQLAERMDWDFLPLASLEHQPVPSYDVGIVVKYHEGFASQIAGLCRRIVLDPLDNWAQADVCPLRHFARDNHRLRFDAIIATSPACEQVMRLAQIGETTPAQVWMLPHGPDHRCGWFRDPNGPVMYCGRKDYLGLAVSTIEEACRRNCKEFLCLPGTPENVARKIGVSLLLHPRLGQSTTSINRFCKPQIKLANASKANLPVLATNDPCVVSLSNNVWTAHSDVWHNAERLAKTLRDASGFLLETELAREDYGHRLMSLLETL